MTPLNVAICVDGLDDNWLGGVNYFRNLVAVFDAAGDPGLVLHLLTDDAVFLGSMKLSDRVRVHTLPMLRRKSAAWAARKALQVASGRDVLLLAQLKRLQVRAVVFSFVLGAASAGIRCWPWIPDFQFKHHPELFPPAVVLGEQQRAEKLLRFGDGLVVSSQVAADDVVHFFGAQRSRVQVLHFAPKFDFVPLVSGALRDEVLARHGIDVPYVFLPNQYWRHKNHTLVLQALVLMQQAGQALPLVVSTGKTEDARNPAHFAQFEAELAQHDLHNNYRVLGVIDRQDMLVLLAHSVAVLNPSRFEGWSTSVEEAKALGKPLLVSDIAVHREQTMGLDNAQQFAVDDPPALAGLLHALQQRVGADAVSAHPPLPNSALYAAFSKQYIALLKRVAALPVTSTMSVT